MDRQIGQFRLHPRCVVVCAGNLLDDNAITVNLSTAMQSRLIHIIMEPSFDQWLENVAFPNNYDDRVAGYLSMYPNHLMQFDPENTEYTFACPRTWEFVNKLIYNEPELDESWLTLLSGTIGSNIAMSFLTFCKFRKDMIPIERIIAEPESILIPETNEVKWTTLFMIISHANKDNLEQIGKFVKRLPIDYQIIYYRAIKSKYEKLRNHPTFLQAMVDLANYFEEE